MVILEMLGREEAGASLVQLEYHDILFKQLDSSALDVPLVIS